MVAWFSQSLFMSRTHLSEMPKDISCSHGKVDERKMSSRRKKKSFACRKNFKGFVSIIQGLSFVSDLNVQCPTYVILAFLCSLAKCVALCILFDFSLSLWILYKFDIFLKVYIYHRSTQLFSLQSTYQLLFIF